MNQKEETDIADAEDENNLTRWIPLSYTAVCCEGSANYLSDWKHKERERERPKEDGNHRFNKGTIEHVLGSTLNLDNSLRQKRRCWVFLEIMSIFFSKVRS